MKEEERPRIPIYVAWPSTSVSGAYSPCYLCGALYKHEADSLRVSCLSGQKCRQPVKSISGHALARRTSQTSLAYDFSRVLITIFTPVNYAPAPSRVISAVHASNNAQSC